MIKTEESTAEAIASKLLEIKAIKLNVSTPFTWSSGWKSPIYCDNRLALSYPELRNIIKQSLTKVIRQYFPGTEVIAGVATAGIPHGALVADLLHLPFVYVRSKPKDHGTGNQIEGKIDPGKKVVLIEDLVSTGGSSLKAAQALREAGFDVVGMAAIFSYGFDVAEKAFEQAGIKLVCLSDFSYLILEAVYKNYVNENQLDHLRNWRKDPANWK
ncbi:MAG: orotate phosphoribosyltransferase [Bacteroidetes bacterium]|nr:orotate phosphoribosyltransferase [Bacteroidota bacterium]MBS1539552.1 orotate phosphoribosyltransferase [Bacteroidota bacterium]